MSTSLMLVPRCFCSGVTACLFGGCSRLLPLIFGELSGRWLAALAAGIKGKLLMLTYQLQLKRSLISFSYRQVHLDFQGCVCWVIVASVHAVITT